MRFVCAALLSVAACWTDAKPPPQTPIGAVEPTAKRRTTEPPTDEQPQVFAQIVGTGDADGLFGPDPPDIYGGLVGNARGGVIFGGGAGAGQGGLSNPRRGGSKQLVTLGPPMISGDYDPAILRRVIRRSLTAIEACYTQQLVVMPTLAGMLALRFTISAEGKVTDAAVDSPPPLHAVAQCVQGLIRTIELPKPIAGAARVTYPISLVAP